MGLCLTPACQQPVSKPGHTLCLDCWRGARQGDPTTPSSSKVPAVPKQLSATRLSEHFNLRVYKVNPTLAEIGLLEKVEQGWAPTARGLALGAQEKFDSRKNSKYVVWPADILENSVFCYAFRSLVDEPSPVTPAPTHDSGFREGLRSQAKYRTNDGHWVRSKAEVLIDNWLYVMGLVHAYERRLPIEAEVYCDFYLPQGRLYIEYWGYEQDPQYTARQAEKRRLYSSMTCLCSN